MHCNTIQILVIVHQHTDKQKIQTQTVAQWAALTLKAISSRQPLDEHVNFIGGSYLHNNKAAIIDLRI